MKQLTHDEFGALDNDRPLHVRFDGVPPFNMRMLLWYDGSWEFVSYSAMGWRMEDSAGTRYLEIVKHGHYHKLPDDIV